LPTILAGASIDRGLARVVLRELAAGTPAT